jgi:hypothetical protein
LGIARNRDQTHSQGQQNAPHSRPPRSILIPQKAKKDGTNGLLFVPGGQ